MDEACHVASQQASVMSPHSPRVVRRQRLRSGTSYFGYSDDDSVSRSYTHDTYENEADVTDYDVIGVPENSLEAQRMINNRKFGFRKWKGHVTERPLSVRSAVVQALYSESYEPVRASTYTVGNVCYVVLFGWWVALLYVLVSALMYGSYAGRRYGGYCLMMAQYFIWPFGKFIHWNSYTYMNLPMLTTSGDNKSITLSHNDETEPIIRPADVLSSYSTLDDVSLDLGHMTGSEQSTEEPEVCEEMRNEIRKFNWRKAESVAWLVLGVPLLGLTHVAAFLLAWLPVVFIPVAKINGRALVRFLLLPPDAVRVEDSTFGSSDNTSDIVLYIHQAVNKYYYKYTVDGMNVILVNMLSIVVIAIITGYADSDHSYVHQETKFALAMISIIPLAYYIGMAITSVSAQTMPAIGALLNATFGSIVEIILYTASLMKEKKEGTVCFAYLVKASLVGTLLATILLIPGLAMVIGGLKHSTQRFNPRATAVSATLLFVSVAAVFAPSIFSSSYRTMHCSHCVNVTSLAKIGDPTTNLTWRLDCNDCRSQDIEEFADSEIYKHYVEPLAYCCMTVLIIAYGVGLVFSLKTHKVHVYESFVPDVVGEASGSGSHGTGHGAPHWGRVKSIVILLVGTTVMCLCADLIVANIEPIIKKSHVSINFIGVTMLAIVPDIPEIVIGIQFALQNSITMSIEVGCTIATQVCMMQIPVLVFLNLTQLVHFHLLFSEIHIWSVALGVFMMNYTFQDGKSDYFQGSALVLAYTAFLFMYYFTPDPSALQC